MGLQMSHIRGGLCGGACPTYASPEQRRKESESTLTERKDKRGRIVYEYSVVPVKGTQACGKVLPDLGASISTEYL